MALFSNKKTDATSKTDKKVVDKKTLAKKEEAVVSMQDLYSEGTSKVTKTSGAKTKKDVSLNLHRVLVKPLITEKATNLGAHNKYVFVVSLKANKISVARAIEETYGIKPLKVNIANASGKKVSRGKVRGQRKDWRKAIVTLPQGKTIKIYEGV